ncbi:hypothetical protein QVD17_41619 [Tagetes erecta]|uniref:Uncharacterized protein n=1 Tax=Tagetes erecta TaxID=13708 RepID=A0AAD8JKT4_TARER|nr:hypothetical protein QVD17_41619 [Tagetes erecta]
MEEAEDQHMCGGIKALVYQTARCRSDFLNHRVADRGNDQDASAMFDREVEQDKLSKVYDALGGQSWESWLHNIKILEDLDFKCWIMDKGENKPQKEDEGLGKGLSHRGDGDVEDHGVSHKNMDNRPTKRPRLPWDMHDPLHPPPPPPRKV